MTDAPTADEPMPEAPPMKAVVFYDAAEDAATTAPIHFPAHHAHMTPYLERGELLMIGPFADILGDGSMAIFATREAAEAFVEDDPFVLEGVVASHRILDWRA